MVGRADRAAAGVRDRPQARRAVSDHHANCATQLALDADAVRRRVWLAILQKSADDLDQLVFVNRTPAQLEIDKDVVGDRRRFVQRLDIGGRRVNDPNEFFHVFEVA